MAVRRTLRCVVIALCFMISWSDTIAQQYAGEVVGVLGASTHKYHGEYVDDLWGNGGFASLFYAPHSRLAIEGRFGLGEIRWKVTPTELIRHPEYFGSGAQLGDLYPGTLTTIEPENESRITTGDLLLHYVFVPDIDAVPTLYAGVGLLSFHPSNDVQHEALPNNSAEIYDKLVATIPVGVGLRIPFSYRAGLLLRAEHRFVFSEWLDDVNIDGSNDGITSISIGLTYRFTNEPEPEEQWVPVVCDCCGEVWMEQIGHPRHHDCPFWHHCDGCGLWHCCKGISHCHDCCCCCCCDGGGGDGGQGSGGGGGGGQGEGGDGGGQGGAEPAARKAFSKDIRFKLDTDEFDFSYPQTRKNLDELLDYMAKAPDGHEVIIEGHASGEGPPQRNKVLSDLRAKKIKEWLIQQGVTPDKIRGTVGYGSSVPKIPEPTPEQMKSMSKEEIEAVRAQNRRIEVHVLKDAYAGGE